MPPQGASFSGGQLLAKAIHRQGISTVFSLAGAAHYRLLDALQQDDVRIISGRHESATLIAADGYSRVTGKPGIALVIANQGLANAVGGLGVAFEAGSPVVVLVARPQISQSEPGAESDVDQLALVRPISKWARTVHAADRLVEYFDLACRKALSGRPGPVVLAIPTNLLAERVDRSIDDEAPLTRPLAAEPSQDGIERAAELIAAAERPMVLAGSGALRARASDGLRILAERFRLPVVGKGMGRGLVPEDDVVGFGWPLAQVAARESDVVAVFGARLDGKVGYGRPPRFSPAARFIQVDALADELGRNQFVEVAITGDAAIAACRLADALERHSFPRTGDPTWVNRAMAGRLARINELGYGDTGPIHPYRMARELMQVLPGDAIVVGDGADVLNWFHAVIRIRQAPGWMDHQPFGTMGVGVPLAVGATAAAQELARSTGTTPRPVVLITGDGSFGFYSTELNGAVLAGLPFVALISNDGGWGTERHAQRQAIGRTVNVDLGQVHYELVAQAYGCHAELVDQPGEVGPAIRRAFAAGKTAVVNFLTDPEAGRLRKEDPRLQMVPYDDIVVAKGGYHSPVVA
jgi:acetolactate synthase-1/2/3 large subunit